MKEVILELQDLFVSGKTASEVQLNYCNPELALFMAALSQMGMSENDNCATSAAMWDLYRMLLRNRHWAFVHYCNPELGYLLEEGLVLKRMFQKISNMNIEVIQCDSVEIDTVDVEKKSNKTRKLPDGVGQGVELLQNGLRLISDRLTQWQPDHVESAELHKKLMNHFSSLEDVIANLAGL